MMEFEDCRYGFHQP